MHAAAVKLGAITAFWHENPGYLGALLLSFCLFIAPEKKSPRVFIRFVLCQTQGEVKWHFPPLSRGSICLQRKQMKLFCYVVNVVFIKLYWQRFPVSLIPTKRIISMFVFFMSFGCFEWLIAAVTIKQHYCTTTQHAEWWLCFQEHKSEKI